DVTPGLEIFGAAIVVFEVIGMFPDVVAKNGEQALGDRIVLIRSGKNLHFAAGLARQPNPSAAKNLSARFIELGLEIFEVAEAFLDGFSNRAAGVASSLGFHNLPKHGVVHVSATIVADGGANVLGNGIQ